MRLNRPVRVVRCARCELYAAVTEEEEPEEFPQCSTAGEREPDKDLSLIHI